MMKIECRIIVFVACVSLKRQESAPARDRSLSPWFRKARRYAEQVADAYSIQSAYHSLLAPESTHVLCSLVLLGAGNVNPV
jgi:hypothetical protein